MVAILVSAPEVKWVLHDTADSILAAFAAPMLADAGAETLSEFEEGDEYAAGVRNEGVWGFTRTDTTPPEIHLWIPGDTPDHVVAHLVGHELGHVMRIGKPSARDEFPADTSEEDLDVAALEDETAADEFGAVAEAVVDFMARRKAAPGA